MLYAAVVIALLPHRVRFLHAPDALIPFLVKLALARCQVPLLPVHALIDWGPLVARTGQSEVVQGHIVLGQGFNSTHVGTKMMHKPCIVLVVSEQASKGVHGPVGNCFEGWHQSIPTVQKIQLFIESEQVLKTNYLRLCNNILFWLL
jgi:hypothetical protein